jgi:disulfide oxidoreductase YuzD
MNPVKVTDGSWETALVKKKYGYKSFLMAFVDIDHGYTSGISDTLETTG